MTLQTTINGDTYTGTLGELLDDTVFNGYSVNYCTKRGTVVMMSERDLRGLLETLSIHANPELHRQIVEGLHTPPSERLSEEEVNF
jgi:hypothetical protein